MLLGYLVSFEKVFRLLKLVNSLSKPVLFTKSACFNIVAKSSAVNLLKFWVVMYLELLDILFSNSLIFVLRRLN